MNTWRLFLLSTASVVSSLAMSQTLPPPDFQGQSYWFGPGPTALSALSSTQLEGGYAEMIYSGGAWTQGVSGGNAFNGFVGDITATFSVSTAVTVVPYIYVDGYFGLTSSIQGIVGTPSSIVLGSSRFFVLHNCPVNVHFANVSQLVLDGLPGNPTLEQFRINIYLANYSTQVQFANGVLVAGDPGSYNFALNVATDGGISQIDLERRLFPLSQPQAGLYAGTAHINVSSM